MSSIPAYRPKTCIGDGLLISPLSSRAKTASNEENLPGNRKPLCLLLWFNGKLQQGPLDWVALVIYYDFGTTKLLISEKSQIWQNKEAQRLDGSDQTALASALHTCLNYNKAQVKVLCVEKDNIEKGIVDFISEHRIKKLVMGAAACRHYSRNSRMSVEVPVKGKLSKILTSWSDELRLRLFKKEARHFMKGLITQWACINSLALFFQTLKNLVLEEEAWDKVRGLKPLYEENPPWQ
nr:U-box domain-containing protein 33-like [Ipomoea batatas]